MSAYHFSNEEWEQKKNVTRLLCLLGLALAITCSYIALKIEWFNAHAQTKLPRQGPYTGKWRVLAPSLVLRAEEREYRMELAYAAQDRGENVDIDKPFTPHQKSIVNARAAKAYHVAVIENDFRDFARSGGLTQTLLAPLLFIVGGICLFHKGRGTKLLGGSYMAVACAVGAIMMYRGYLFGFV